jgi:uncharacterized protein (TIGR02646 family)
MKFIQKKPEPDAFIQWKQRATENWQPSWDNFQKPEKNIVHTALTIEQGHICCYCGQRITQGSSHIEHFQPRTYYPELSLSYNNFLASCPGYPEELESKTNVTKLPQEFCGQRKGSWFDLNLAAIDAAMQDIETLSNKDIQKLIDGYDRPDNSGKHIPFWAAVIHTLQQMI